MSEDLSERILEGMSERMLDRTLSDMPERMAERISKDMSERIFKEDCLQAVCEVEGGRTHFRMRISCVSTLT